ncbi:CocE/NonD family hydrolase [Herbiconiux sp. YIM B11900]|uniref:CocE/NonD family hydrolase n=1 Tax=Herbiconiux sp. YIM B11900 TaxID=3404131 RepID=UPI003F855406
MTGWGLVLAVGALPLASSPAFATEAPLSAPAPALASASALASATALAPASAPAATVPTGAAAGTTAVTPGVTHAQNPSVPAGAAWTEEYFPSSVPSNNGDPVELHADVLRPAGLAPGEKTPVIMSIGSYFSHSGMNNDTHPPHTGPSQRFTDLIDGAGLMARGYTFVYVDLRGFGGSTGCIEWLGAGEQADVVSAVEWAAQQSWSTGSVGLYGKSYDGSTGLVGVDLQPEGLKAVVAQEPAWSGYDYLITNGVSRQNQVDTPLAYLGIADLPGVERTYHQDGYDIAPDTEHYMQNAAYETTHPECAQTLIAETKEMDRQSDFWRIRDLPANVNGSTVPLMFTQGLTEQNTKPESMQLFLANHAGEQRGWLGPWDHVRGNEVDSTGALQMGRAGWFDEVMAFYDAHLKEHTTEISSSFFVQDNLGAWRVQDAWGTTDKTATVSLRPGSYLDTGRGTVTDDDEPGPANPGLLPDGSDDGSGDGHAHEVGDPSRDGDSSRDGDGDPEGDGQTADAPDSHDPSLGILTLSQPLRTDVRLTGTPTVELHTQGSGNVAVQLLDVAPDLSAVAINHSVARLSDDGVTRFGLLGMDWTLQAGHHLAVTVATIDWGYWVPEPSGTEVVVSSGTVDIAVESTVADVPAEGARAPFLDEYLHDFTRDLPLPATAETFTLSAALGQIRTDATTVRAGDELVIAGAGYDPGAPVTLIRQDGVGSTATTEADGSFRVAVRIPETTPAGVTTISAVAEDGGRSTVEVEVEVVAAAVPAPSPTPSPSVPVPADAGIPTPQLARTGASTDALAPLAAGAALALLLGATLVRRRRRAAAGPLDR